MPNLPSFDEREDFGVKVLDRLLPLLLFAVAITGLCVLMSAIIPRASEPLT